MLFGLQATRHENPFSSPISKPIHNEKVSTPILRPDQKLTVSQNQQKLNSMFLSFFFVFWFLNILLGGTAQFCP